MVAQNDHLTEAFLIEIVCLYRTINIGGNFERFIHTVKKSSKLYLGILIRLLSTYKEFWNVFVFTVLETRTI